MRAVVCVASCLQDDQFWTTVHMLGFQYGAPHQTVQIPGQVFRRKHVLTPDERFLVILVADTPCDVSAQRLVAFDMERVSSQSVKVKHDDVIDFVVCSVNQLLAFVLTPTYIFVYDLQSGQLHMTLTISTNDMSACAVEEDGGFLYVASECGRVHVLKLDTWEELGSFEFDDGPIGDVMLTTTDEVVLVRSKYVNTVHALRQKDLLDHCRPTDATLQQSAARGFSLQLADVTNAQVLFTKHNDSSGSCELLTCSKTGLLSCWDLETCTSTSQYPLSVGAQTLWPTHVVYCKQSQHAFFHDSESAIILDTTDKCVTNTCSFQPATIVATATDDVSSVYVLLAKGKRYSVACVNLPSGLERSRIDIDEAMYGDHFRMFLTRNNKFLVFHVRHFRSYPAFP